MNYEDKYPILSNFLGGYFYMYWEDDHKSVQEVIDKFSKTGYKFERYRILKEIDDLLGKNYTEEKLSDILFIEFGTYCHIDNSKTKKFLIDLRSQLLSTIDSLSTDDKLIEHLSSNLKKLESLRDNYTNKKELLEELNKIRFYKNDCEQGIRNPLKFVKNEIVDWKRILEQKTQEIEDISEYAKEIEAQRNGNK